MLVDPASKLVYWPRFYGVFFEGRHAQSERSIDRDVMGKAMRYGR
jgi:hypothetical protein